MKRNRDPQACSYSVKAVSRLLGLSPHTLRAWEKRYGAVEPIRTDSGHRAYSEPQVKRLKLLAALVIRGHTISQIAGASDTQLEKLLATAPTPSASAVAESAALALPSVPEPASPETTRRTRPAVAQSLIPKLVSSLERYRLDELAQQLAWARIACSAREFVLEIAAPLLREVGLRVDAEKLGIAQEHALSAMLRDQMAQVLPLHVVHRVRHDGGGLKRILLTTPDGNRHEFGILLAAILVSHYRLPLDYLGPSLPVKEIATAARALGTDVVLLGVLPIPESDMKEPVRETLAALRRELPAGCEIWVGGYLDEATRTAFLRAGGAYFPSLEALDEKLDGEASAAVSRS